MSSRCLNLGVLPSLLETHHNQHVTSYLLFLLNKASFTNSRYLPSLRTRAQISLCPSQGEWNLGCSCRPLKINPRLFSVLQNKIAGNVEIYSKTLPCKLPVSAAPGLVRAPHVHSRDRLAASVRLGPQLLSSTFYAYLIMSHQ